MSGVLTFYENGKAQIQGPGVSPISVPDTIILESILVVKNGKVLDYKLNLAPNLENLNGQIIEVHKKEVVYSGMLLDFNTSKIKLLRDDSSIVFLQNPDTIIIPKIKNDVYTTIEVLNETKPIFVSYLCEGFEVTPNYTMILNSDSSMMKLLRCEIRIKNNTTLNWITPKINFIIGEVAPKDEFKPRETVRAYQSAQMAETKTTYTPIQGFQKVTLEETKNIESNETVILKLFEIKNTPIKAIYKLNLNPSEEVVKAQWGIKFNTGNNYFPSGNVTIYKEAEDLDYVGTAELQKSLILNHDQNLYFGYNNDVTAKTHLKTQKNDKISLYNFDIALKIDNPKNTDLITLIYDNWNISNLTKPPLLSAIGAVIKYVSNANNTISFELTKISKNVVSIEIELSLDEE